MKIYRFTFRKDAGIITTDQTNTDKQRKREANMIDGPGDGWFIQASVIMSGHQCLIDENTKTLYRVARYINDPHTRYTGEIIPGYHTLPTAERLMNGLNDGTIIDVTPVRTYL